MPATVDRPRSPHTSRYYWEREHEPGEKFIPYFWQEFTSQVMILFLFLGVMGGLALLWPNGLGLTRQSSGDAGQHEAGVVLPEPLSAPASRAGARRHHRAGRDRDRHDPAAVRRPQPVRNPLHKPVTTTIALVLIVATVALTIWGMVAS